MPFLVRKRVRRGPNPDWMAGQVISDEEAQAASRLRLLVQSEYLEPITDEPEPELEPEPVGLESHTIMQLRGILPGVTDVNVIRDAMSRDGRSTAQTLYEDRLRDLEE